MSKYHYERIKDQIDITLSLYDKKTIQDIRDNIKFVNCQFTSFCWYVARASQVNFSSLYDNHLNDSNILTALKKILKEYK